MVDIIKHEAEIACLIDCVRQRLTVLDQFEMRRKFARAEAGLVEALSLAGTTIKGVEMLSPVVVGPGPRRQREARADHVGDIRQHAGSTLLAVIFDNERETADLTGLHRCANRASRRLGAHLVAPNRLKTDRFEDVDFVDDPFDRRLPVDGFKDPARGGRRHHVIGDPLNLHFRARK